MGTRADFYIGRGPDAEWLGSVALDGYLWDDPDSDLMKAKTSDEFRAAVSAIEADRNHFTAPAEGWPWPWDDSNTTDYAYVMHEGKATAYVFGREAVDDESDERPKVDFFPDMSARKNVQWGSKSGLIVLAVKPT